MEEIKQYKSLDDLKKIISDLEGFMARPVVRGAHPTIYPEVGWGQVLHFTSGLMAGMSIVRPDPYSLGWVPAFNCLFLAKN